MSLSQTYYEKPADFSFSQLKTCDADFFTEEVGLESAKYARVKGVPNRGPQKKYLTKSVWLNHNKLRNFKNIDQLVNVILEKPDNLGWLDLSFNRITNIDESILKFPNLKILYLHANCITDLNEVYKLRPLRNLKSLTLHGNPVANHQRYRPYIIAVLNQLDNIDFTGITKVEKRTPAPAEALKILKAKKKDEKESKSKL